MRRSAWLRWVVLGTFLSASGCYAHVQLSAPPATAPLAARKKAWHDLKALSYEVTETRNQTGAVMGRSANYLSLADGQEVHYPEDLLPVVPARSACAAAVSRYLPAAHAAEVANWIGYPLAAVGLAVSLYGLGQTTAALDLPTNGPQQVAMNQGQTVMYAGLATMLVGGVVAAVGQLVWGTRAAQERETAFGDYDDGLMSRLALKPQGGLQDANPKASAPPAHAAGAAK